MALVVTRTTERLSPVQPLVLRFRSPERWKSSSCSTDITSMTAAEDTASLTGCDDTTEHGAMDHYEEETPCSSPSEHTPIIPIENNNNNNDDQKRTSCGRKSILKCSSADIPIRWKQYDGRYLEPGDDSRSATENPTGLPRKKKQVKFRNVCIRNYEQCIGDNPAVSYGTPIALDWEYEELNPLDLEQYEATRGRRRTLRQLMMNYYDRRNLLTLRYGYTEQELDAAEKQINTLRRNRSLTRALLPASRVQELLYTAARKTKRIWPNKSNGRRKDSANEHAEQKQWLDA